MRHARGVIAQFIIVAIYAFASVACHDTSKHTSAPDSALGGLNLCDDPLFPGGKLDPSAYVALAADLASEAAIAFRYGGGCAASGLPGPVVSLPHHCEPSHQQLQIHPGNSFSYELGMKDLTKNDYSMTDGQVLYAADDHVGDSGVGHYTSVIMDQGVFGESAQLTWQFGNKLPDAYFGAPNSLNAAGITLAGGPLMRPVAMARGSSGWSEDALVVLADRVIGGAGTFTGRTSFYFQFPVGKQPVGIALTNNNEFALVTIWDTVALKSQVAVVALGSGKKFWGDWTELYPGLENYGMYTFAKILGYVDLPGVVAATEISAASDFNPCQELPYACWLANHKQFSDVSLSIEANRQTFVGTKFVNGTNIGAYSRAGFAAVISPAEQKLIVLDLGPLFAWTTKMYFGSLADFTRTRTMGQAPSEWPYDFSVAPEAMPKVAEVIDLAARPTAVKVSRMSGTLLMSTVEGTLHAYDVGTLAGRHAATATGNLIAEITSVAVGANVTGIADVKQHWTKLVPADSMMVLSRAEHRIDWVHLASGALVIDRTLHDDRMVDPLSLEDSDNHGTESYVLSVADYGGKQVLDYRYGPVVYHTNGGATFEMCESGTNAFEFGGALSVPGKPFALSVNNTP